MNEYDSEPIRGLPANLPPGEAILWQGAPCWKSLARRALHARAVAIYFAVLLAWSATTAIYDGVGREAAVASLLWLTLLAGFVVGLLSLLAWLIARTTVYTITNRRVVVRFGVALPMSVNIPFKRIESAALRAYADGTGDLPLTMAEGSRIGYLVMWPHVRPWRLAKPQPMLRAIPQAAAVADTLSEALAAAADSAGRRVPASQANAGWSGAQPRPLTPAMS